MAADAPPLSAERLAGAIALIENDPCEVGDMLDADASEAYAVVLAAAKRALAEARKPASDEEEQLTVDVLVMEGEEPFIVAVHGRATTDVLVEIERGLPDAFADTAHPDGTHTAASGVYRCRMAHEEGQYDHEGRCELAPGWYVDGYDRIEEIPTAPAGRDDAAEEVERG